MRAGKEWVKSKESRTMEYSEWVLGVQGEVQKSGQLEPELSGIFKIYHLRVFLECSW